MSTGVFSTTANVGATLYWRQKQLAQRRAAMATIDAFADHLAEHGDVRRAAQQCGVSASYGRVLLQKLRRALGWQSA